MIKYRNLTDPEDGQGLLVLIDEFKKEIAKKGLAEQVFVSACSDVGGKKYAGDVIIFGEYYSDGEHPENKVMGDWYGNVTAADVPQLIDEHIGKGAIVGRLWRGEVCSSAVKEVEICSSAVKVTEIDDVDLDSLELEKEYRLMDPAELDRQLADLESVMTTNEPVLDEK